MMLQTLRYLLFSISLLLFAAQPSFSQQAANTIELVNSGLAAYNKGDGEKALYYYRQAAKLGSTAAWHNIGGIYLEGRGTVKPDIGKAHYYYHVASLLGFKKSQYLLASQLEQGKGTYVEQIEALKWYMLSDIQGFDSASQRIKELLPTVPSDKWKEAQKRAEAFTPLPYDQLYPILYVHQQLTNPYPVAPDQNFNTAVIFKLLDPRVMDEELTIKYAYTIMQDKDVYLVSDVEEITVKNGQTASFILQGLQAGHSPGNYTLRFGISCNGWRWSFYQDLPVQN